MKIYYPPLRMTARTLLLSLALGLTGCTHYLPAAVSSTSLGPKERPVGVVNGISSAYYFLGIGPSGDDSLRAAVEDALSQGKADTMVNVFVDRQVMNFPFDFFPVFSLIRTSVYGTLVQYPELRSPAPKPDNDLTKPL